MNKDPKISNLQLRGLMVSNVIGVGVLSLPNALAEPVGNNGWLVIIISGALIIGLFSIYNQIFQLYPGKDIFEISRETLGLLYYPFMMILLAYFILTATIVARNIGELMKIFLLQTTPIGVIIIVFILASAYITSYEIDSIARMGYLVYPIIIIFSVLIVLISLPKADFTNMLPVLQTDLKSIGQGVMISFFSFAGIEISFFAIPYVEDKSKILKSGIYGIITVTLIYLALGIMTLSHFSMNQVKNTTYPILLLVRQLDLPGFFLENLDGLIIALWVLVVFATFVPNYFGAAKILARTFKVKKHKYFVIGLLPVIFVFSILPENFIVLLEIIQKYHNILALFALVVSPVATLVLAYVRKKVKN